MLAPALAAPVPSEADVGGGSCSCAQARDLVMQQARRQGLRAEVQCSLSVNEPSASCPPATLRSPQPSLRAGPLRVVVRSTATDGAAHERSVALRLGLRSQAWVAVSPIAVGEPLNPALLEQREVAWPNGVPPPPLVAQPPEGRARRALRAGEPVLPEALLLPTERRQGDPVEIVIREGAVSIAMPGVLVRDASVGQPTRAQIRGRREVLDGQLIDLHTVVLMP